MSCAFRIGDHVLWNPATDVGRLFLGQAALLASFTGYDTGLGELAEDGCQIDPEAFAAFTEALVNRCQRVRQGVLQVLTSGFVATALVLVARAGRAAGHFGPGVPADFMEHEYPGRWQALCDEAARSMSRFS